MAKAMTGKQKAAAAKAGGAPEPEKVVDKKKAATKKPQANAVVIPTVNPKALSVDVGPRVAIGMAKYAETLAQANQMIQQEESKRYDLLAQLTGAIVKAANADKGINLAAVFSGDLKQVNMLNDQLGLALGFRRVVTVGEGDAAKQRVVTAKELEAIWPRMGETANNSDEYKRKATVRSNFLHALKKCAQAAEGIRAEGLKMKTDKSGTLMLSGPSIKSTFGADSVLLNEKQTIGEGDKKKKLDAKPSFTAIADMGARAHGKVMKVRKDSRASSVDPVTAFVSVCTALVAGIAKLGDKPDAKCKEALAGVQSAIDKSGLVE